MSLESFISSYVMCALFAETDPNTEEPLDLKYDAGDITEAAMEDMVTDCKRFYTDPRNQDGLEMWRTSFGSDEQAGHDFWLTRNGHGAGFWDRFSGDTPEARMGKVLTDAAKLYGQCSLYVSETGVIEVL